MRKIKITAVSYLNTKPLLYGLLNSPLADQVELSLDIPSECARKLREGEVDLALTPVAILPELKKWHLVSDYCIGAVGEVKTVNIYSEVPIEEITALYLDHHSRSSVALSRVLLRDHWRITPKLLQAKEGYINQIKGNIAGVVIGDRTIGLERSFPYVYDLSLAWQSLTGLPFVFAAWVSTQSLPEAFKLAFNEALKAGIAAIPKLKLLLPSPDPSFDLETYFTSYISYNLDEAKREALHKFLSYVAALEPFHPQISRSSQPVQLLNCFGKKTTNTMSNQLALATLGGGCFWCVEAIFEQVEGVHAVMSGYSGGDKATADYKTVCSGTTKHAEVVQVSFDPSVTSYQEILEIFFTTHDPTTPNRQGNDVGPQYRSVVFYHDEAQKAIAEKIKADYAPKVWDAPIVTEIAPFEKLFPAEEYHHGYYSKVGERNPYCTFVITPKVSKFRKLFSHKMKAKSQQQRFSGC